MTDGIKAHVKIEQHPNPKIRDFHVTCEVSAIRGIYGFGENEMMNFGEKSPGDLAETLAKKLMTIPGVTGGNFKRYEVRVDISDAFSWQDVGPLVLGEIVKNLFPETNGATIDISTRIGWSYFVRPSPAYDFMGEDDDGHRTRYVDMVNRQAVEVKFGSGRPILDVEHLFGSEALTQAKAKAAAEVVIED